MRKLLQKSINYEKSIKTSCNCIDRKISDWNAERKIKLENVKQLETLSELSCETRAVVTYPQFWALYSRWLFIIIKMVINSSLDRIREKGKSYTQACAEMEIKNQQNCLFIKAVSGFAGRSVRSGIVRRRLIQIESIAVVYLPRYTELETCSVPT